MKTWKAQSAIYGQLVRRPDAAVTGALNVLPRTALRSGGVATQTVNRPLLLPRTMIASVVLYGASRLEKLV